MSIRPRSRSTRAFARLAAGLLAGLVLCAAALDDLPSSVASRVKKIEAALTAADEALELDRLQTAQRKLKDTERPLKEIADRYAGTFDEAHPDYRAMREHLEAITARVRAAEGAASAGAESEAAALAEHEALCQHWVDALGPFVTRGGADFLPIAAELNRRSPEERKACMDGYRRLARLHAEYEQVTFARPKSRELLDIDNSLRSVLRYYGDLAADAVQEQACQEWVDLLAPYADVGMNSRRYLVVGATLDAQELAARTALFEEARDVFAIYERTEFPQGKTFRLQTLEQRLREKLDGFPAVLAESRALLSGDVAERLARVQRQLERDTDWTRDETVKPPVVMELTLQPLREAVERYATTAEPGDARLAELRGVLAAIDARNAEHAAIRAERTFQLPDAYGGDDLAMLKQHALDVAQRAHRAARLHEVTLPSAAWSVEDVIEFTDTSRTALRRRVTRSVRAQVSLTAADGAVWLQEVYLGQDRLPDGGWGALQGHTTWADAMSPANLGKRPPQA